MNWKSSPHGATRRGRQYQPRNPVEQIVFYTPPNSTHREDIPAQVQDRIDISERRVILKSLPKEILKEDAEATACHTPPIP